MLRTALATLTAFLFLTTNAAAWTPPGDRSANNALVNQFVEVAEQFWAARGVAPCPTANLDVRLADDLSDGDAFERADGRAVLSGCRVWFLASLVAKAQSGRPGNDDQIYLCRIVVHELGHTGGLDDSNEGVMNPAGVYAESTPFECRQWGARAVAHAGAMPRAPHIEITIGTCPDAAAWGDMLEGCTYPDGHIYVSASSKPFLRAHEMGHVFDFEVLTDGDHHWFARMFGIRGPWSDWKREVFADAYANCDLRTKPWADHGKLVGLFEGGHGYNPPLKRHRAICDAIKRIGRR
jgi:hypothetical protein